VKKVALVAFMVLAFLGGTAMTHADTPVRQHGPSVVGQFNDGFAEAKQDDCEQGFQPACDWLKG
jgi:hypothetical protein